MPALLGCGVVALGLYVGMDAIAALRYDGYHYADQTISELSAIGAPTRSFWLPLGFVHSALMLLFAAGLWRTARQRLLQVVGLLAASVGVLGVVGWPFAPMHQRAVLAAGGGTWSDTMHLVLSGVSSLLFLVSIAVGARVLGKKFCVYSIATLVVMLAAGSWTGMMAPEVSANAATPWLGIAERIAVFSPMLWYAVLAIGLLRTEEDAHPGRRESVIPFEACPPPNDALRRG
jgi:hypothetical protein